MSTTITKTFPINLMISVKLPRGVKETIDRSMYRHWKYTSRSKASLWGVVFNAFYNPSLNDEVLTDQIFIQDLGSNKHTVTQYFYQFGNICFHYQVTSFINSERMPISQIEWPTSAYNRKDVSFSPYIDRTG